MSCEASTSPSPRPLSVAPHRQRPKRCSICLGHASGFHYDVPSCNSCKTFFRRTVTSGVTPKCRHPELATLLAKDLVQCRGCRFRKCVQSGMNPDAVGRTERVAKLAVAIKRTSSSEEADDEAASGPIVEIGASLNVGAWAQTARRISLVMTLEDKVAFLRRSTFRYDDIGAATLRDLLPRRSVLGNSTKYEDINEPPDHSFETAVYRARTYKYGLILLDLLITIEYAKSFDFFNRLSEFDQLALIRSAGLNCAFLTEAFDSYSHEADTIMFTGGGFLVQHMKKKKLVADSLLDSICSQGVAPFTRLRIDSTEYALLKTIVLCHSGLSYAGRRIVEVERQSFTSVLLEYCMRRHGDPEGPARFTSLLSLVGLFLRVTQKYRYFNLLMKINGTDRFWMHSTCQDLHDELVD